MNECRKRLVAAGFKELRERDPWQVQPTEKVLVKHMAHQLWGVSGSKICLFYVPKAQFK